MQVITLLSLLLVAQSLPVKSPQSPHSYIDPETKSYYISDGSVIGTDLYQPYNKYSNQPYVANGYFGSRISNLGFGFTYDQNENSSSAELSNGWPLFNARYAGTFLAGFYDTQNSTKGTNFPELHENGESVIAAIPYWADFLLVLTLDGVEHTLDPKSPPQINEISNYNQELLMKTGTVRTRYTWLGLLDVQVTLVAHREVHSLGAAQLTLSSRSGSSLEVQIQSFLDMESTQICELDNVGVSDGSIGYMSIHPFNVSSHNAALAFKTLIGESPMKNITLSQNKVSFTQNVSVTAPLNITHFFGLASSEIDTEYFQAALQVVRNANDFDALMESHSAAWSKVWGRSKITVPSDEITTLAGQASIYHLLANTRDSSSGVNSALAVGGLSSDSYGGMVFWDTDLWMIPAMIPFAPSAAKAVQKYRDYTHAQAIENARGRNYSGAVYPWTSGGGNIPGSCTGTGPCFDYEYHLNIDIAYSIWRLWLSGSMNDQDLLSQGYPIFTDAADFFAEYVDFDTTLGKYTTRNLTDPDEYANHIDNGAFTNVGISQLMKWTILISRHLSLPVKPKWQHIMENMYIPVSAHNITLQYSGMNSSIEVKQADVVMITFPLDDEDGALQRNFGYDKNRALADLNYYSEHQSSHGPAMTYPVLSVVRGKIAEHGCSFTTYLNKGIKPFLRFPFAQMSEQNNDIYDSNGGTHPAFPFLTGHGGTLLSLVYGLTGIKYGYTVENNTVSRRLLFDPFHLKGLPGGVSVEGFAYDGQLLDIVIDDDWGRLFHKEGNASIEVYVDSRNSDSGTHYILPGQSLSVPLYRTEQNVGDSISECVETSNFDPGMHGELVMAINDGDNFTTWQSEEPTACVMLDLGTEKSFSEALVLWGNNPAKLISLGIHPESSTVVNVDKFTSILHKHEVVVTEPYDQAAIMDVQIDPDNSTHIVFNRTYTSRYILLTMEDTITPGDNGATLAEVILL